MAERRAPSVPLRRPPPPREMSAADLTALVPEEQLQEQVRQLAKHRDFLYFHPWRSDHSPSGWLDVFAAKVGARLVYVIVAELKKVGKKPTTDQERWLAFWRRLGSALAPFEALVKVRIVVKVWTPADFADVEATFDADV